MTRRAKFFCAMHPIFLQSWPCSGLKMFFDSSEVSCLFTNRYVPHWWAEWKPIRRQLPPSESCFAQVWWACCILWRDHAPVSPLLGSTNLQEKRPKLGYLQSPECNLDSKLWHKRSKAATTQPAQSSRLDTRANIQFQAPVKTRIQTNSQWWRNDNFDRHCETFKTISFKTVCGKITETLWA